MCKEAKAIDHTSDCGAVCQPLGARSQLGPDPLRRLLARRLSRDKAHRLGRRHAGREREVWPGGVVAAPAPSQRCLEPSETDHGPASVAPGRRRRRRRQQQQSASRQSKLSPATPPTTDPTMMDAVREMPPPPLLALAPPDGSEPLAADDDEPNRVDGLAKETGRDVWAASVES